MKRNRILWLRGVALSVSTLFLWLGCHRLPVGDTFPVLYGSVIDASTHRPIDSAWVTLFDSRNGTVYTDTTGSFAIGGFVISEDTLIAGKTGYLTSSKILKDIYRDTSGIVFELVREH